MGIRYVVDEEGERVAVLLDIEEYERMVGEQPEDGEDFDPEEAERRITEFVTTSDELPGPTVADLAERVVGLMRTTWDDIEEIMDGIPHNKLLATQLLLSQRARGLQPDDPEQWRLFAATTLLSGMVPASLDKQR
ncbi:MAG: hypothetical protein ACR2HO_00890 [Rubrobacteraceae bacterium]|nr:hypothetical protein [Rubrobacter sp.]